MILKIYCLVYDSVALIACVQVTVSYFLVNEVPDDDESLLK